MAKKPSSSSVPQGPTLIPSQALPRLQEARSHALTLAESPELGEETYDAWTTQARHWLERAFGEESDKVWRVINAGPRQVWDSRMSAAQKRERYATQLRASAAQLSALVSVLEQELASEAHSVSETHSVTGTSKEISREAKAMPDRKKVFIIHGRNRQARKEMGIFVRSLGLEPINFDDLRASMGGTPSVAEIVTKGMKDAQGVIAIFTPEEYAVLRPEHRGDGEKGPMVERWQARPNVIFEAGMAYANDPKRVVFITLGAVDTFSDIAGIHTLSPKNDAKGHRNTLRNTLASMDLDLNESSDWMDHGDFEACVKEFSGVLPSDPFRFEG